ncbi:MAG: aldo/keto reductase [Eubacteriales bacterium]|jgi:aryl-alcohol dehydrogenase-like predicted oxidoreductase
MEQKMETRPLGKTGIRVSRICYGSLSMAPLQGNYPVERAAEVMSYAFSRGITFVDCAQLYRVYPQVRAALKRTDRDIIIASKSYAYTRQMAFDAVEEARRELDRDVIDIFMLHEQESVYTLRGHKEALEELYRLKSCGIIRAVGISTHYVAAVDAAVSWGLDVVFPLLNVDGWGIVDGTRDQMEQAVRRAVDAGLGVFTMKVFGGGNLHKKAAACLDYALSLPVASVAIGMQDEQEVDANLHYFMTGSFTPEQEAALHAKKRRLFVEEWCVGCGKCVERCGQHAAKIVDGHMVPDAEKCVLCGYCSTVCDQCCIKVL